MSSIVGKGHLRRPMTPMTDTTPRPPPVGQSRARKIHHIGQIRFPFGAGLWRWRAFLPRRRGHARFFHSYLLPVPTSSAAIAAAYRPRSAPGPLVKSGAAPRYNTRTSHHPSTPPATAYTGAAHSAARLRRRTPHHPHASPPFVTCGRRRRLRLPARVPLSCPESPRPRPRARGLALPRPAPAVVAQVPRHLNLHRPPRQGRQRWAAFAAGPPAIAAVVIGSSNSFGSFVLFSLGRVNQPITLIPPPLSSQPLARPVSCPPNRPPRFPRTAIPQIHPPPRLYWTHSLH